MQHDTEISGLRHYYPKRSISTGRVAIIIAIGVIAISYGLFFFMQGVIEANVKINIFDRNQENQVQSTKAMAEHIESDLNSLSNRLGIMAANPVYRSGDLSSTTARSELTGALKDLNTIAEKESAQEQSKNEDLGGGTTDVNAQIGDLYLVDSSGKVTIDASFTGNSDMEGKNLPDVVLKKTLDTGIPQVSDGYPGEDGQYRIAATYPIFRESQTTGGSQNREVLGLVVEAMTTKAFFEHYGNIYDIKSQYIAILDSNSVQLIHPVKSLVGTPFFGDYTQNITGHNEKLNNLIHRVMSGTPDSAIYPFVNGERLTSGYPIYFNGELTYFVFIITPTSAIYSSIDSLLYAQKTETFALIVGTTTAIGILIFLLARWNGSLDKVVKSRTVEIATSNEQLQSVNSKLEESNKQLSYANQRLIDMNEQLKKNESIQREFIDVAAHELRTPIQPIVGLAEMMKGSTSDPKMLSLIDVIQRNAKRLQLLSSNILDVARLESETLPLRKIEVDLRQLVSAVTDEFNSQLKTRPGLKLSVVHEQEDENNPIIVAADKERIIQVLSNLISNAIKFTDEGEIKLTLKSENKVAVVIIRDSGAGIDPIVISKLFLKFTTTSDKGTGLGLFISKKIIEAHGGKIWAENNKEGKGATFAFSLPIISSGLTNANVSDKDAHYGVL